MVKDLSSGQRQRLFIVLALTPSPKVVFLDGLPTGLDAKARRRRVDNPGGPKATGSDHPPTSHYMDVIETLCDEIWRLRLSGT